MSRVGPRSIGNTVFYPITCVLRCSYVSKHLILRSIITGQWCNNATQKLMLWSVYFTTSVSIYVHHTLLPGLGPRFLGKAPGSGSLADRRPASPNSEVFWPHASATFVFLRPGWRPFWPGGLLPAVGLGCIAKFCKLPSVTVPGLSCNNTTVKGKEARETLRQADATDCPSESGFQVKRTV